MKRLVYLLTLTALPAQLLIADYKAMMEARREGGAQAMPPAGYVAKPAAATSYAAEPMPQVEPDRDQKIYDELLENKFDEAEAETEAGEKELIL